MFKMSDNARKRCRKSKLVPRDCADFVEDDSVLQEPAQKKLLLEKIKKEPEDFIPPEVASHKFSVNVEVEDVDEAVPEEDSSSYMQYLFSLSKESQSTEPITDFEFADNNLLLENKLAIEEDNFSFIDVRKVQKMLVSLHKKYPNDKEAVMYTRNQWGKAFNERYAFEFRKSPVDDQLQDILKQWRTWTISARCRESPFSYKCYICSNAWWSLSEFKSHLTIHEEFKLLLETQHQECNIVAYEGNVPGLKEVYVHGKCLKCAKTYDHHLTNKSASDAYYLCNYCKEKFVTCSALTKHEGTCPQNPIRVLSLSQDGKEYKFSDFSCQICNTVFLSNTDLTEHLLICHKVRSDDPIAMKLNNCKLCYRSYYTYQFHICLKKNLVHECKYCHTKFQNKQMLENHLEMWNKVFRCKICDKYLMRGCMAGEHYALHSENFTLVHRCLVCRKKMKIFMDEDGFRHHRIRYHNRFTAKRPQSDKIIMAKIMLQQCMLDPNAKKTIPTILRVNTDPAPTQASLDTDPAPAKAPVTLGSISDPKAIGSMIRGVPMQKVRVFVPPKKNKDLLPPMLETTICHDNEVTNTTEEMPSDTDIIVKAVEAISPENDIIKIKEEKIDDINENQEIDNNKNVPENIQPDTSNTVIKEEIVTDKVVENEKPPELLLTQLDVKIEKNEGGKDFPKLMEELNEFLDIKPDIIKIKEEKLSDDEASHTLQSKVDNIETESDLSKVFQSSSTFAEEVTENSEHSNVFKVSKSILESVTVKQEIKKEPPELEDLIIIDSSEDKKQKSATSDNTELSLLNLQPEVILKAGYRKRKVYRCSKCDYSGFHREYKEHINTHFLRPKKGKEGRRKKEPEMIFKCNKCRSKFASLKQYALHFEKHGYKYMSCPQCAQQFDSVTRLISHLNNHIKTQYVRMLVISDSEDKNSKVYQCKTCKEVQDVTGHFEHWEKHLELLKKPVDPVPELTKFGAKGEHPLDIKILKQTIELLLSQEKTECTRLKTCNICNRLFERRNDLKRHFIEHLLEDAYANMDDANRLKCQICGDLHVNAHIYKKHMRDHACLPIYKCSLCNKTFSDSSNFTKHKKIHNLKAYVCDICSKKFQAKVSLEKHIEMHMTTEPMPCEHCGKVFHERSFFKRHIRQFHQKRVNRHRCFICKEAFFCLKDKWEHMWLAHKQRKDKADCPVCRRSYRKFTDVKKHAAQEHGIHVSLSDVWTLLNKLGDTAEEEKEARQSSDDDCLLIEEERETLVVYD